MRALVLGCVAVGVVAGLVGCVFDSKQVTLSHSIQPDSLVVATNAPLSNFPIDLNVEESYRSRKSEIKSIADVALLGQLRNTGITYVRVEWWMTTDPTTFTNATAVRLNGFPVWMGPEMSPRDTLELTWNHAAGLVHRDSFDKLLEQIQGDGIFTLYAIGSITGTSYQFTVIDPKLVLVVGTDS